MPFCPICREAYVSGVEICADCNEPLVKKLPPVTVSDKEDAEIAEYVYDEPAFLCTLQDNAITAMLIAALKEQGIPAMKKTRGAGVYINIYTCGGFSNFDADIYVPSRLLEKAKEISAVIV